MRFYPDPGFGILQEKENKIRDSNYAQDTGFSDLTRRESRDLTLKNRFFKGSHTGDRSCHVNKT